MNLATSSDGGRTDALVEQLPLVTYTVALEAPFAALYVSPQVRPLFGFEPAELQTEHDFWTRRIHPDDQTHFRDALAELGAGHGTMSVEYRVNAGDGREVWVRDVAVASVGDDGRAVAHGYLTDVTREKQLELELVFERAQADAFFRDSAVGLAITDAEGRYVRVNPALARLNRATVEAHIGRTIEEVAPQVAADVAPIYETVLRTGIAVHQHELTAGGSTVLLSVFPLELGGVRHFGRIVVDITEQRRAERERSSAEEHQRRLIEQLPLTTYVNSVDPVRNVTFASPQIEVLTGYTPQEFIEDPELGDRIIHPDDFNRIVRVEEKVLPLGQRFELEYRIVRKDGTVRWVLDLMETISDENGEPLYEQGFLVDITERHETEDLFRAVFDNAFEGIVIFDDTGHYVDANAAACRVFARTKDELLESNIGEISAEDPAELYAKFIAGGEMSGDYVILRPDGSSREIEFAARANVQPGMHVSVIRDVTQRRQLERELWRAQKLESVGRLAGGVAQDFNNMLTAIRGHAQLLEGRTRPDSAEYRHAQDIDRAAERAAALTSQLLALGRRQTLQSRPVDLNRLADKLDDMLRPLMHDGTELTLDLCPALCAVRVDPSQIEQVLLNLVANAADATGSGGSVAVRTSNVELGTESETGLPAGRYALVEVEDTGSGIEPHVLEHLFEPFFTTKDIGEGTGLGLATAYGIVKQSGGSIDVITELGRGSTFSVYLPAIRAQAIGTILVVETDPAVRDVLFELLSEAAYRVHTASTAGDAVRLSEQCRDRFDLLVADLTEPTAAALVGALQASRPDLRTLSLQKPYTPERLLAEVRAALERT